MNRPPKKCRYCDAEIPKDALGLNRKLFERDTRRDLFMCLPCMASFLECVVEDLIEKIADLKAEGCRLFS